MIRIIITQRTFKREADRTRCLTGTFWVVVINGEPAYRCATRGEAVAMLGEV